MAAILTTIAEHVRGVVQQRRCSAPMSALRERPLYSVPTRGFAKALSGTTRRVIAEIKKASPSKGLIRPDFDPLAIALDYATHGASAISVLTEEKFFQGDLNYLEQIHAAVSVPLLRKDFMLDSYQVIEAKSYGADAVLLIAAMIGTSLMSDLRTQAGELGLDCLVEVHNEKELEAALTCGADLIGINNRDLHTFEVDLATTARLAPLVPAGKPVVCESGIDSAEQIHRIEPLGIHIFLVGESLMRAAHPGEKLSELLA
jgi:indole-3-glycerol phosphate synthase